MAGPPARASRSAAEGTPTGHAPTAERGSQRRWAATAGAQLLIVDPDEARAGVRDALAGRGVHVTWVPSTTDALVVFGRSDPEAVVVAPEATGVSAAEFVTTIRRHGSPYVIAALRGEPGAEAAELMVAGVSAWVARPYSADDLWSQLSSSPRPIGERVRVTVGPLELDAAAYLVSIGGQRIPDLPLKEFELLRTLMLRTPDIVRDDEVRVALWGSTSDAPSGNTIAMHVTRLRARLGAVATVRRIRGRGYSLSLDV